MSYLFCARSGWESYGCNTAAASFNEDISAWGHLGRDDDVQDVLQEASAFDHDIGGWAVDSVTDMGAMFYGASLLDQDIGGWAVRLVRRLA